jgi:hypothetical protein
MSTHERAIVPRRVGRKGTNRRLGGWAFWAKQRGRSADV